jgi:hypothetical protein
MTIKRAHVLIETDETELMAFACQWLKFSLFGEKTLQLVVTQ